MAIDDVLTAPTVRPVHIGFFDIKDDPIYGWTGPGLFAPTGTGDLDLDDNVFESAAGAIDVTEFHEDQGIGSALSLTFAVGEEYGGWILGQSQLGIDALGDPKGSIWDQIVIDRRQFLGRKAVIWLGFLNSDESGVLSDIQRMFTGVMVQASASRRTGSGTTITLKCDQDLQKANVPPSLIVDHQNFYSGDAFSSYMADLARGPVSGAVSNPFARSSNTTSSGTSTRRTSTTTRSGGRGFPRG